MIFMWPSALMALVAGLMSYDLVPQVASPEFWGGLFLTVFAINMMVVTFDFPRGTSLTLVLGGIALTWLFVELNRRYNLIQPLQAFLDELELIAAPDFYFFLFVLYLVLFTGMIIATRFNYWEISSNELVHHKGMMQDVERYATEGLQYRKEITDFFEYLLAGSGRIVLSAPAMPTPVVLNNVPGINRIARNLDAILEVRRVALTNEVAAPAPPA
jgi:hypothetical protein